MPSIKRTLLVLGWLAAAPVFGQSLLPPSFGNFAAFSRQTFTPGTQPVLDKVSADQASAAQAAAREYGFLSGETASYGRTDAGPSVAGLPDTLVVNLYHMKDVSGAYGQYSFLRTPEMQPATFTTHSSMKSGEALILIGNVVLDVSGPALARDATDVKALAAAVAAKAEDGLVPSLPDRLPVKDRIDRSDHYILGPETLNQFFPGQIGYFLGFTYGTEAETAHFRLKGRDTTLLIADFPTPQIAQGQLEALAKKFNINGSLPGVSPALFAKRNQTLLSIAAGPSSTEEAAPLLDQVKSGTILTWDEPTFELKEPPIQVMIVGAFIGTGFLCVIAVVAGFAFGGFRLAIKRMFPNTLFDRSTQLDILQLGLASKPIKSGDFYAFDGKKVESTIVDKNLPDRIALRIFR